MKMVLSRMDGVSRGFILDKDRLREVFDLDEGDQRVPQAGDIILGVIRDLHRELGGAFVRLMRTSQGGECMGFLPLSDIPAGVDIRPERTLAVQIVSMPAGVKPYKLTGKFSLAGEYAVVSENGKGLSVSRRLSGTIRNDILRELNDLVPQHCAATVRTKAGKLSENERGTAVASELLRLCEQLEEIRRNESLRTPLSFLYRAPDPLTARIRDLDPEEIIADLPSGILFGRSDLPEDYRGIFREYRDAGGSMYRTVFGIDRQYRQAMSRKVYLDSGAYIIIDHTEALTAIDVNSGKRIVGKKTSRHAETGEETAFAVNREAAAEIFLQIRLRNLSGMILIDYVNMTEEHRRILAEDMKKLCADDPVPTRFLDFTQLGLAEVTRKKTGEALDTGKC